MPKHALWTLQDQLDWEVLREGPDDLAARVAARRPDLVQVRDDAAAFLRDALVAEGVLRA